MKRVHNWTLNTEVASADLNTIQDRAVGLVTASLNNTLPAIIRGMDGVAWQCNTDVANGTLIAVDATIDWRDRLILAWYRGYAGTNGPGTSGDYTYASTTLYSNIYYTGLGARDAGGVNAPTNGNVPVPAADTSWALNITAGGVWIYADPSNNGTLTLYNNSGSAVKSPNLIVFATNKTTLR
jgi:hypothetical protein